MSLTGTHVGHYRLCECLGQGSYRVYRGGSWSDPAGRARVPNRRYDGPGGRDYTLGLRLVRSDP
jgi:formylglycine-generating enzyme required for sulfatase activity